MTNPEVELPPMPRTSEEIVDEAIEKLKRDFAKLRTRSETMTIQGERNE